VHGPRLPELDVLKATAIVAVVLIHAIPPFWDRDATTVEQVIGHLTRFGVPAFLAVSGFLYYQPTPIRHGQMQRRLRRILVPYVCVSLLAFAYDTAYPGHAATGSLASGLLLGGTFGPYYYVVLLVQFVAVAWILSRVPPRVAHLLLAVATGIAIWSELQLWIWTDPFWTARNGLVWAVWFLLGWVAASYAPAVMHLTGTYRTAILTVTGMVVMLAVWAVTAQHGGWIVARGLELVSVFASLAWLFTFGRNVGRLPASVAVLSDWTYAIYLLHPFFIYLVADVLVPTTGITAAGTWPIQWLAGVGGAVAATAILRRLFGPRSRDLIGA
jgi:peptidoglycan/LPS O-acetylase OafA/YrhL